MNCEKHEKDKNKKSKTKVILPIYLRIEVPKVHLSIISAFNLNANSYNSKFVLQIIDHDPEKVQQRRDHGYLETGDLSALNELLERIDQCFQSTKETLDKYGWQYFRKDH